MDLNIEVCSFLQGHHLYQKNKRKKKGSLKSFWGGKLYVLLLVNIVFIVSLINVLYIPGEGQRRDCVSIEKLY